MRSSLRQGIRVQLCTRAFPPNHGMHIAIRFRKVRRSHPKVNGCCKIRGGITARVLVEAWRVGPERLPDVGAMLGSRLTVALCLLVN